MKVACVVPAFNEADRIGRVLDVVSRCTGVNEVIVIDDGSTDGTHAAASRYEGLRVYSLPRNAGKGAAMQAGATLTNADVLLFLDADLINLTQDHVERLLAPVVSGDATMAIGRFRGGRFLTDLAQKISPNISGQRAVLRDHFLKVPRLQAARMDVEVRINRYARRHRWRVKYVSLLKVTHPLKEEKLGVFRGVLARTRMYREILVAVLLDRNGADGATPATAVVKLIERRRTKHSVRNDRR